MIHRSCFSRPSGFAPLNCSACADKGEKLKMGNHIVGNMFASAAAALAPYIDGFSQEEAENALDGIWNFVKESYYFSNDAEFDDFTNFDQPLGKLLIKVFAFDKYQKSLTIDWGTAPDEIWEEFDDIESQFSKKYGLC